MSDTPKPENTDAPVVLKHTMIISVEQMEGDHQKMNVKFDPPLTETSMTTDPTAVSISRLFDYVKHGMEGEYEEVKPEGDTPTEAEA
tara:strand:- start:1924 stop:2184 length:261 start_codon:yes stop_codon:yes gene_type:complete